MTEYKIIRFSTLSVIVIAALITSATCRAQDSVFKIRAGGGNSKLSGKITEVTPEGVTIDGDFVAGPEIRKLVFSREPSEIARARSRMESGRFADCIAELANIKSPAKTEAILQEVDFLRAFSNSQISLRGGAVTAQDAGKELGAFIKNHPSSYHLYAAMEQYAKQLFAFGKLELAAAEFEKLGKVQWNEYKLKGLLGHGMVLGDLKQFPQALASFDAILQIQANDDMTQAYQLLAQCEKAKISGLQGNVEESKKVLETLIREQSPDGPGSKRLFAHLYNALGAIYEESGGFQQASLAYLKTELLYPNVAERHAEALYHLALIWPKRGEPERASRARDTLKSRHRNSYWAGKL